MNDKRPHGRIHQVIIQRRSKAKLQASSDIDTACSKQLLKPPVSAKSSLANSYLLSQSQVPSFVQQKSGLIGGQQKNFYKISQFIGSQSLESSKAEDSYLKRQIKSARPVSRRKITSKEKSRTIINQSEELFKIEAKKSQVFEPLQILDQQYFILQKEDSKSKSKEREVKNVKTFWAKQHMFVSLFPLEYTQCVIYNHPNILPVYGEVTLKNRRFIVSNEYKHCSLKDLIKEFGAFDQKLCKIYLRQVLSGLQEMHERKIAHNRLSTQSILYNKQGRIFINVVRSTSRPLTQKEKQERMFEYSPEILLTKSKSNSRRSDIWSIGILLLDMLFNFEVSDPRYMNFHPYNALDEQLNSNDAIIVDNLKQLYGNSFKSENRSGLEKEIMRKFQQLSQQCKDVILKCLRMNRDERITLKALTEHRFFNN